MEIKSSTQVLNSPLKNQKNISDEVSPNRGGGVVPPPEKTDTVAISAEAQALLDEVTPNRGGGNVVVTKPTSENEQALSDEITPKRGGGNVVVKT